MYLNFLYCFDRNFNVQGAVAINSLLNNVTSKVNIYIIHDEVDSFNMYLQIIKKHKNLNSVQIYKFNKSSVKLPTFKTHFSEATFYRLFMSEYLPKNIEHIMYLDADILCLNNPEIEVKNTIIKMKDENRTLAATTVGTRADSKELFEKLGLKNNKHLNAGVLLVDYVKWNELKIQEKLISILNERFEKIFHFDQELLNVLFDGDYTELGETLNFGYTKMENDPIEMQKVKRDVIFLHYSGKGKPWNVENIPYLSSRPYQEEYQNLNLDKYHLEFNKSFKTFRRFIKIVLNGKFLRLKYPKSYLLLSMRQLLKLR